MAQFCWKIRQLSTTSSKQNVHVVYLLCLLLKKQKQKNKKNNFKLIQNARILGLSWGQQKSETQNCRKGEDFYEIHVQHVHCTLNWGMLMSASFVLYTVCVYSAHRQVLPYSSRSKVSPWLLRTGCHSWLGPAFPLEVSQVVSFLFFSPQ